MIFIYLHSLLATVLWFFVCVFFFFVVLWFFLVALGFTVYTSVLL